MDLVYERGRPDKPRGHAIVYFRSGGVPEKLYATYVIVLPISVDFAKYVPPFLASSLGSAAIGDLSAFSLPPMPEEAASWAELDRLAAIRDDDLIFAGNILSYDTPRMMESVTEVVQAYSSSWSNTSSAQLQPEFPESLEPASQDAVGINEVLFGLLSERDKLAELSKLVSKLRFAVESTDPQIQEDAKGEIELLTKFLPENYYIPALIQAVLDSSIKGAQLAKLYLDRCYKLSSGEMAGAQDLERLIESLRDTE